MITALIRTGQVRVFWIHLRTDHESDQVTVDHFRNSDDVMGLSRSRWRRPMCTSGILAVGPISGTSSSCYRFRENVLRRNTFFISIGCLFPRGTSGLLDLWQFGGTLKRFEIYKLIQSFLAARLNLTQPPAAKYASFRTAVANWLHKHIGIRSRCAHLSRIAKGGAAVSSLIPRQLRPGQRP
jgi:hypothetical protein